MDTVNEALNKKLYPGVNTDVLKVRRRSNHGSNAKHRSWSLND